MSKNGKGMSLTDLLRGSENSKAGRIATEVERPNKRKAHGAIEEVVPPPPPVPNMRVRRRLEREHQDKLKRAALVSNLKRADLPTSPSIVLVHAADHCRAVCREIAASHTVIGLDCEAAGMRRSGELCLVQVSASSIASHPIAGKVYLFDVTVAAESDGAGGESLFAAGLRALLENDRIVKVIHDCRLDSDILQHRHRTTLVRCFDTQIAHSVIRQGDGSRAPLPAGLNNVLRQYAGGATNTFKDGAREAMRADERYWARRPMDATMIGYAAEDVSYLPYVYRQMRAIMSPGQLKLTAKFSAEYERQARDAPEETIRTGDGIPKYGIDFWDEEIQSGLEARRTTASASAKHVPVAKVTAQVPPENANIPATAAAAAAAEAEATATASAQQAAANRRIPWLTKRERQDRLFAATPHERFVCGEDEKGAQLEAERLELEKQQHSAVAAAVAAAVEKEAGSAEPVQSNQSGKPGVPDAPASPAGSERSWTYESCSDSEEKK
jgi:hypothetical protein